MTEQTVVKKKVKKKKTSQENGKKGGVKTEEGKAVSSQNAIKHGVLSNSLSEYDKLSSIALYKRLAVEFEVETTSQRMLLEQLVLCYIKLARYSRFESEIMNEAVSTIDNPNHLKLDWGDEKVTPEDAKALIDEQTFKRMELVLTRYEPQLINRLMGLIRVLKSYQSDKKKS